MEPLAPRSNRRRQRSSDPPHHRDPRPDVEARIAAAIAQRTSQQGGSAEASAVQNESLSDIGNESQAKYEYLDHTADIQLHAWGETWEEALENALMALFGYMVTDLNTIETCETIEAFEVTAHDRPSLVFHVLQEWLGRFHETGFVPRTVAVVVKAGDSAFAVNTSGEGESFDANKHPSGTEVKAITFSNLQVQQTEQNRWDIWVIVDI